MKRFLKHLVVFDLFTSIYLYITFKLPFLTIISIKYKKFKIYLRTGKIDFFVLNQIFCDEQYKSTQYIKNAKIILDLGANIGLTTLYFKSIFPEATIICVEPETENFKMLEKNTAQLSSVFLENKGVWSHSTTIFIENNTKYSDGFTVSEKKSEKTMASIDCLSIIEIIKKYNLLQIDILKMDIEGSEKIILESNPDEWLSITKCLMIETHDRIMKNSAKTLFEALRNYSYDLEVSGETLKFFNLSKIN